MSEPEYVCCRWCDERLDEHTEERAQKCYAAWKTREERNANSEAS